MRPSINIQMIQKCKRFTKRVLNIEHVYLFCYDAKSSNLLITNHVNVQPFEEMRRLCLG